MMDDLDTRDVIEFEVLVRNVAFESFWKYICSVLVNFGEVMEMFVYFMKFFCGFLLNGDGEKIGCVWFVMF